MKSYIEIKQCFERACGKSIISLKDMVIEKGFDRRTWGDKAGLEGPSRPRGQQQSWHLVGDVFGNRDCLGVTVQAR